jgi:hypothetical protein
MIRDSLSNRFGSGVGWCCGPARGGSKIDEEGLSGRVGARLLMFGRSEPTYCVKAVSDRCWLYGNPDNRRPTHVDPATPCTSPALVSYSSAQLFRVISVSCVLAAFNWLVSSHHHCFHYRATPISFYNTGRWLLSQLDTKATRKIHL